MEAVIKIIIFILIGILAYVLVNVAFNKLILKKKDSINLKFLRSICHAAVIITILFILFSQFSMTKDISSTLLRGSALVVAILTFAAQKTLGNIISGFSITIAHPFEVGQKIKVVNGSNILAEGYIKDITVRHTVIQQYDGQSCIVPNSVMDESVIINTNYEGYIGNYIEIEISYDSDIQKARKIFRGIIKEQILCINKKNINIYVSRFTPNGLVLKTTIWTETLDDNFIACSIIREKIIERFRENGIRIPYQTVTVKNAENNGNIEGGQSWTTG